MNNLIQKLRKIAKYLEAGIEEHPFFKRLQDKSNNTLHLKIITQSNLFSLPYFEEIRVIGVNTHETTDIISLGLRIGDQSYEGSILYYHTAILPMKLNPLKFKFILNVLSNV